MSSSKLKFNIRDGVGRRILLLFLTAAFVPMVFTAGLAQFEMSRSQSMRTAAELRDSAKDFGTQILVRLEDASHRVDDLMRAAPDVSSVNLKDNEILLDGFDAIWKLGQLLPTGVSLGGKGRFVVAAPRIDAARAGQPQLLITDQSKLALLKSVAGNGADNSVVVVQMSATVWGSREDSPPSTDFCVFTAGGLQLYCSAAVAPDFHGKILAAGAGPRSALAAEIGGGDGQHVVLRQLFLDGMFGAESLDIVAIRAKRVAAGTIADFRRVFLPAVALVLVLVCVLSYYQIGNSLGPLQYLTAAARQIAAGNFSSRVAVQTGDEFESLGKAFNNMAERLGRQISALEAMSGIDRMILSGTKLEDVSEDVIRHLVNITECDSAGVIARDIDAPDNAQMISLSRDNTYHDRIELPEHAGTEWRQPRQIDLHSVDASTEPYTERFLEFGQRFVVLIPTVLNSDFKGVLLLGFDKQFDMSHSRMQPCIDLAGRFAVALASVEREEALYRQAHYDALTGLPNRQLLKDRLEQYLASARVENHSGALLFLDLDRFKEINDIFGHSVGDTVLRQAGDRIVAQVRERDTVARLGGDEFVVVLPNVRNDHIVRATAERLMRALSESFAVKGIDHYVSASIGIAMFPADGATVETLLKNADAAMYRAKDAGRNRFEFFSKQLNAESRRKITIERDLRAAFQQGDLEVYYQPQFNITSNDVSGAEALLRWHHPKKGAISPGEFIPLAEDSELIVEIGAWVIEQVCDDVRSLLEKDLHPGTISINVSARQLADRSLKNAVLTPMRRHGINPAYMQLEVTETTVAQNKDIAVAVLQSLRDEGVRVAIDDFGTGYSSLSYLEQMPFDVIKIDKSFIDRIGSSATSDNICRTIIKMAEQLGKKSIAEGVETESQLSFLKSSECDFVQGYYYSMPLPAGDFKKFIAKQDLHTQRRKALELV